ncbi:MAG: AtpZ/AtpI family protein [Lachnospiraceae bacterium]|jgi:ATP synthase protein I|nr:AtpZ/AtpI family protein [Lachnospiraceae bacterium]
MNRNPVGKAFTLILQIGLVMLVAVFMCVLAAVWLNEKFNTIWFMPPFLVLGIGGGIRGAWNLVKSYTKREKNRETETNDYIASLKAEGQKNREAGKTSAERKADTDEDDLNDIFGG